MRRIVNFRGMNPLLRVRRAWRRSENLLVLLASLVSLIWMAGCGKESNPVRYPEPVITDIPEVSAVSNYQATISWTTDIEATTAVRYGTTSGSYTFKDSSSAVKTTTHRVTLSSLRSNTFYYFIVQSKSAGGFVLSDEGTFQTTMSNADLVQAAWAKYQQDQIGDAIELFTRLQAALPQSSDAFTGLGWCYAHPQIDSLETALIYFNGALALNGADLDALAGRGFVRLALNYFSQAAADFEKVLAAKPDYLFPHNNKVTAKSLRLGLAEARFYLQAFASVQSQIDLLAPGNGLDPGRAATWNVDGLAFASYPEALLGWIEKLKAQG